MRRAWLFPCPGNLLLSIVKKLMKFVMKHQVSTLFLIFHSVPTPFLHTASDQKLDGGKAWERGYL